MHIMAYVSDDVSGNAHAGASAAATVPAFASESWRNGSGPARFCTVPVRAGLAIGDTLNRPAISWAGFEVKRILGTCRSRADGSASFEVPAERFVYFQLLDPTDDGGTMRSGTQSPAGRDAGLHRLP